MTGNEIREKFLEYFERHGHTRVRSSPLLPANDPTLLFTNAGMNQFKDVFLGAEKRDYVRACSSQKCLRAGGKHNDLDEVGKTARHQTFFEMLGNFSFGDYFKEDGIKFAWEFLVDELKMDPRRLWFTVFGGDDEVGPDEEAEKLWEKVGAPRERILRFGRKDNFWQMADTGPCGPCSEVHYYLGDDPGDPNKNRVDLVNGPGDTTMEIWNLVFMQYNRIEIESGKYNLEPLPKPSVDTGLGLERTAVIMQGVQSNYETDLLQPIINFTAKLADRHYEAETTEGFAMRVIADHARATAFSITDGILAGNEGRNYVIRKIMRRAIYQGRHALGFDGLFFHQVTNFVVDQMGQAYPELESHREFIEKMVKLEEERFGSTLTVGLARLDELFGKAPKDGMIPMVELARAYDTFGVPRDLIRISLIERGQVFAQDEVTFNEAFDDALRQLQGGESSDARSPTKAKTRHVLSNAAFRGGFTGYDETTTSPVFIRAMSKDDSHVEELTAGEQGEVILSRTPFYAEAGGQVGDTGVLVSLDGTVRASVTDTVLIEPALILHRITVERGTMKSYSAPHLAFGDTLATPTELPMPDARPDLWFTAQVDVEKRDATRRNHTATHLVHSALREVLGSHVKQAGSVVAPNYLRFDFTHYQPMTEAELKDVERLVNEQVLRNVKVETDVMPVEDAIRGGAMALFGEKYSGMMRVLTVPGFSKELCGGTHVRATGDIGVFKITSDESIASGVRRIRAVTGLDAYERFREDEEIIDEVTSNLRSSRADLPSVIGKLQDELKKARREADDLKLKIATGAVGTAATNGDEGREVAGVKVLAREAGGLDAAGMRQLSDTLLARIKSGVVVLGRSNDGKASLIVRTSEDLSKRVPAGQVIKELAPIIGGKGGGKADMAEGGGSQPEKLAEALEASYAVIERMLS
ncbi:MAG: alanine--tRNA ligase [Acidobacteriota bacterium]